MSVVVVVAVGDCCILDTTNHVIKSISTLLLLIPAATPQFNYGLSHGGV